MKTNLAIVSRCTSWVLGITALVLVISAPPLAQATSNDDRVEERLEARFEKLALKNVDVDVEAGTVTLTGEVRSAKDSEQAVSLAKAEGAQRINNQIRVKPQGSDGNTMEAVTDTWITTKIKAQYADDDVMDNSDVNVDTNNDGVVTLTGTVTTNIAREHAEAVARQTKGVRKVMNHLKIKS